ARKFSKAAKRAADLPHQWVAFARRQPPRDQVVDVNKLVAETAGLLQRLIGPQIELETVLAPDAGPVRAGPSQLQQVLMNLAANARDAMLFGGRLTIRTSRTKITAAGKTDAGPSPQHYVTLQVADTGHGMDEATQARIFEP